MYHIKNDKRAQTSAELICAGLLACMREKPFARITITDVQRASTVSRSTFYRNFDGLEDVLALLCDRGFQTVFAAYNALPAAQRGSLPKAVFHYWFHNSAVLEALVQIHRTDILFDSLRRSTGLIEALRPLTDDRAQFDGNFLGPKILGDSTGLTGFWVIFAITVFGGLFGILGMIVGVPIFAVIYAAIKAVVNTFLRKKDLPVETVKYSYLKNIDEEGFHQLDSRLQRDHEIKDQVDFGQDKKDQEEKNVGEK